ncbi:hypothetical protein OG618_37365 (plasmid) [Kitasatospora sp. NBC_01246]|uniref:hypothetical protein n=1 Tax=Kitasatospora sp. NBC_01246 TaxID=2903570 RepID=UPI002E3225B8|nr:hypothetical protein [Kitasatospora sp. NBC_01246]
MNPFQRIRRRLASSASAGLAAVAAFWDSGAPAAVRPDSSTSYLFPGDQLTIHIHQRADGEVTGTLCGPFGFITAEPDQLVALGDMAVLAAETVRMRRERAAAERTDQS